MWRAWPSRDDIYNFHVGWTHCLNIERKPSLSIAIVFRSVATGRLNFDMCAVDGTYRSWKSSKFIKCFAGGNHFRFSLGHLHKISPLRRNRTRDSRQNITHSGSTYTSKIGNRNLHRSKCIESQTDQQLSDWADVTRSMYEYQMKQLSEKNILSIFQFLPFLIVFQGRANDLEYSHYRGFR